jgi:hypothetical protein
MKSAGIYPSKIPARCCSEFRNSILTSEQHDVVAAN